MSVVVQCLTGRALDWASTIWRQGSTVSAEYSEFKQLVKTVFDHLDQGQWSSQLLLQLKQGMKSAADYAIRFRILAVESGWNSATLLPVFRQGLTPDLQLELACLDAKLDLDGLITLPIWISISKTSLARHPPPNAPAHALDPVQLPEEHLHPICFGKAI